MKLLLSVLMGIFSSVAVAQSATIIKAGKLYNAETNSFQRNIQVLITNDKVEKLGTNLTVPPNTTVIDCPTCTITPGLTDMHTHVLYKENVGSRSVLDDAVYNTDADRSLRAVKVLRNYLKGGFTTLRDVGNSGQYLDISLRNALRRGDIEGPGFFASGPIISPYGGQTYLLPYGSQPLVEKEYRVIKSVDDARQAVLEHVNLGVDVIKICADNTPGNLLMTTEQIQAITETAHDYGIKVTAHATFDKSVRRAVLAGVDGIEHGYDVSDSTLSLMKQRNVYLVPTDASFDEAVKIYKMQNVSPDSAYIRQVVHSFQERLMRAWRKGVTIVFGSDFYFNIPLNESEASRNGLLSYYEAGMPVNEVLRTATWNAATQLGRQGQIGIIREKGIADITVFDGDLEKDFPTVLFKVKMVFKKGKMVQL